jgi:hypothetical protein
MPLALPAPVIAEHDGFLVVRDDYIAGGTKRRALPALMQEGAEFVYASPVYGYAQIALAYAAQALAKQATIFCAKRAELHERTREANAAGARIVQVPHGRLNVIQARAREYCAHNGAVLLPFGLDTDRFLDALADVARTLPIAPPAQVWTVAGSGVLTRALQRAWPDAEFHAVLVGHQAQIGKAIAHYAPEKFEEDAAAPPPFPSCSNYDAKAWAFMKASAAPGALFWNVA